MFCESTTIFVLIQVIIDIRNNIYIFKTFQQKKKKLISNIIIFATVLRTLLNSLNRVIKNWQMFCLYSSLRLELSNKRRLPFVLIVVPPYMYQVDSLSITAIEENSVNMACYLIVGQVSGLNWTWTLNGVALLNSNKYQIDTSQNTSSTLIINKLSITDKGDYICTAINAYGSHYRTTTLRVKSN